MAPTRSPLVARFCAGALPAEAWTHEAHLRVAYELLDELGDPGGVVALLRTLIPAHNARVGTPPERGYHETITRYYVGAVAVAMTSGAEGLDEGPASFGEVVTHPACDRRAPLRHWSAAVLGSAEARQGWVQPDREPLPAGWPAGEPATCRASR